MRILHVGWGFRPWRTGGLIAYVEDVLAGQAARGHEVAYFFAGRYLPGSPPPHMRRWRRGGVTMLELFNSRILPGVEAGSLDPDLELTEPAAEAAFRRAVEIARPELVHVQELVGLPSSVLTIPRERGIPVVLSMEDYHPLCPTVKLFDADGRNCRRQRPGEMCQVCCAAAPADAVERTRATVKHVVLRTDRAMMRYESAAARVLQGPELAPARAALGRLRRPPAAPVETPEPAPPPLRSAAPGAYDRRRAVNVERLSAVDRVLAMSHGVARIAGELGVAGERVRVLHFTLSHLAGIRAAPREEPRDPMVFCVLNGCASVPKGVDVVLDALAELDRRGLRGRYRLDVWGFVAWWRRAELEAHPDVALRGNYTAGDLDAALADADAGIVPSVWEEAYAYTGPELLAAGVPVIGNVRGGIPDYVREGETGWRNESASGAELAAIMARLIDAPGEVAELRRRLRARRPEAVKPMAVHLDELDAVYAELRAARPVLS